MAELNKNTRETINEIEIDVFLKKDKGFWENLETECVVECCGIDALDFTKENIQQAILLFDRKKILNNCYNLMIEIENSSYENIHSSLLNSYLKKDEFLKTLKKVIKRIERIHNHDN